MSMEHDERLRKVKEYDKIVEDYRRCYNCGSWIKKKYDKCVCGVELHD